MKLTFYPSLHQTFTSSRQTQRQFISWSSSPLSAESLSFLNTNTSISSLTNAIRRFHSIGFTNFETNEQLAPLFHFVAPSCSTNRLGSSFVTSVLNTSTTRARATANTTPAQNNTNNTNTNNNNNNGKTFSDDDDELDETVVVLSTCEIKDYCEYEEFVTQLDVAMKLTCRMYSTGFSNWIKQQENTAFTLDRLIDIALNSDSIDFHRIITGLVWLTESYTEVSMIECCQTLLSKWHSSGQLNKIIQFAVEMIHYWFLQHKNKLQQQQQQPQQQRSSTSDVKSIQLALDDISLLFFQLEQRENSLSSMDIEESQETSREPLETPASGISQSGIAENGVYASVEVDDSFNTSSSDAINNLTANNNDNDNNMSNTDSTTETATALNIDTNNANTQEEAQTAEIPSTTTNNIHIHSHSHSHRINTRNRRQRHQQLLDQQRSLQERLQIVSKPIPRIQQICYFIALSITTLTSKQIKTLILTVTSNWSFSVVASFLRQLDSAFAAVCVLGRKYQRDYQRALDEKAARKKNLVSNFLFENPFSSVDRHEELFVASPLNGLQSLTPCLGTTIDFVKLNADFTNKLKEFCHGFIGILQKEIQDTHLQTLQSIKQLYETRIAVAELKIEMAKFNLAIAKYKSAISSMPTCSVSSTSSTSSSSSSSSDSSPTQTALEPMGSVGSVEEEEAAAAATTAAATAEVFEVSNSTLASNNSMQIDTTNNADHSMNNSNHELSEEELPSNLLLSTQENENDDNSMKYLEENKDGK